MKIQLKRSNVLEGGSAKAPTAGQMEYGELAVNYNGDDPALFIKDHNNQIIRIAGDNAVGNIIENIEGYPDINDGNGTTLDGRYVKLAGGATQQTITGTGGLEVEGPVTAGKGLTIHGGKFFGGTAADNAVLPHIFSYADANGMRIAMAPRSADATKSVELSLHPPQSSNGGGARIVHDKTSGGGSQNILRLNGAWTGNYTASGSVTSFNAACMVGLDVKGAIIAPDGPVAGFGVGFRVNSDSNVVSFLAQKRHSNDTEAAESWIGFKSDINSGSANKAFNFYASGSAPNFFKGDTYIGGTTDNLGTTTNITLLSSGRGEFAGGVQVTGGTQSGVLSGLYFSSGYDGLVLTSTLDDTDTATEVVGIQSYIANRKTSNIDKLTNVQATNFTNPDGSEVDDWRMFEAVNPLQSKISDGGTVYGFYSAVTAKTSGRTGYGFYAAGSAPNYFAGSTYIGGTTARNTVELWKSTLTDEQLEQFEAGTFAVPANVSAPGDGSYARQWYYDQQDAETQALLDSGELAYPAPLAAATFSDTFALGDNTKINLNSNGLGEFTGGIEVGGNINNVYTGLGNFGSNKDRLLLKSGDTVVVGLAQDGSTTLGFDGADASVDPVIVRFNGSGGSGAAVSDDNGLLQFASRNTSGTVQPCAKFGPVITSDATSSNNIEAKLSFQLNSGGGVDEKASIDSNGVGEFAGGVRVTGGTISTVENGLAYVNNGVVAIAANKGLLLDVSLNDATVFNSDNFNSLVKTALVVKDDMAGKKLRGFDSRINIDDENDSVGEIVAISGRLFAANSTYNNKGDVDIYKAFEAPNYQVSDSWGRGHGKITGTAYGFYSDIAKSASITGDAYNFYAEGSAPNYFKGNILIKENPNHEPSDGRNFIDINSTRFLSNNGQSAGQGYNSLFRRANNGIYIYFDSYNSGTDTKTRIGSIEKKDDAISIVGLNGGPLLLDEGADARQVTSTEEISNAAAVVQALQPVKINGTRHGFTAGGLQSVFAEAVSGTAGATEAIGTYTDPDGNVETEVTEPEAIPYGATWTETGTRDVYQGVDQTKLIPILTKALQEALERIEALENA